MENSALSPNLHSRETLRFGFSTRRVLTDNGSCYRDGTFRMVVLNRHHIKYRFTRPDTPRTNGKAERAFSRPLSGNGPMPAPYDNFVERELQLDPWLHDYNFHRPHASLHHNTPVSRSGLNRNNLLRLPC